MIKECPVILNNEAVTVVRFDNIDIQFASIGKNAKTIFVKSENGKYAMVNNAEEQDKAKNINKTKTRKKTIRKKDDEVEN